MQVKATELELVKVNEDNRPVNQDQVLDYHGEEEQSLKQENINTWLEDNDSKLGKKKPKNTKVINLLGIFILGMVIILAFYIPRLQNGDLTPELLYDKFYTPHHALQLNTNNLNINLAGKNYLQGNYAESVQLLDGLNEKTGFISERNLLLGLSFLEMNNTDKAITFFKEACAIDTLKDDARWYLGLSYLKSGNLAGAEVIFHELKSSSSPYNKEARKILKGITYIRN